MIKSFSGISMFWKIYFSFIILIFYNSISFAFGQASAGVEVVTPRSQEIYEKVHSAGIINSPESVDLLAESTGKIIHIYFNNGGTVRGGDVLAQIDDQVAKANLSIAVANLNLAQLKSDRANKLLKVNASSQANLDQAIAELALAKSELIKRRDELEKTKVIAPFDGTIGFKLKQEYEMVNAGDKIFRLERFNPLEVEFNLPRKFHRTVKVGDKVEYKIDYDANTDGQIIAVSEVINPENESFSVRASVINTGNKFIPGIFTSIDVITDLHQALIVPQQSVVSTEKGLILFKIQEGKIRSVPIVKGVDFGDMVEVKKGVSEVDQIVISGQMKLHEGMEVHPLSVEEKK